PPLHEGVLNASVDGIALEEPRRNHKVVEDMQDRDRDDRGDVEPDRDVEVPLTALRDGPEEVDGEEDPDNCDSNVDRPLELRVFLRLAHAERQSESGADNDR